MASARREGGGDGAAVTAPVLLSSLKHVWWASRRWFQCEQVEDTRCWHGDRGLRGGLLCGGCGGAGSEPPLKTLCKRRRRNHYRYLKRKLISCKKSGKKK